MSKNKPVKMRSPVQGGTIDADDWVPHANVTVFRGPNLTNPKSFSMMVDSGAFQAMVPKHLGKEFGFHHTKTDKAMQYHTDAGSSSFLDRKATILLEGHKHPITIPVAWGQGKEDFEPTLGRLGLFGTYDVRVSQVDHKV
eukprot:PhF_6_TR16622/c0_g1_i1/m.25313